MKEEVLKMLRLAIEEIETGRARGCFVACFGQEPEDKFSISACDPGIRNVVIEEAQFMLNDIRAAQGRAMN